MTFLPSPLLNPAVYSTFADTLGLSVAPVVGDTTESILGGFLGAAEGSDLIVAHSNAGRFGPAVANAVGAQLVVVDGMLPAMPRNEALRARLRELADDNGVLPAWTSWWPRADLVSFQPYWDVIATNEPNVRLDMLLTDPPAPTVEAGYVSLGNTYDDIVARVPEWPHRRLDGHHLQFLADPEGVAKAVRDVANELNLVPA